MLVPVDRPDGTGQRSDVSTHHRKDLFALRVGLDEVLDGLRENPRVVGMDQGVYPAVETTVQIATPTSIFGDVGEARALGKSGDEVIEQLRAIPESAQGGAHQLLSHWVSPRERASAPQRLRERLEDFRRGAGAHRGARHLKRLTPRQREAIRKPLRQLP